MGMLTTPLPAAKLVAFTMVFILVLSTAPGTAAAQTALPADDHLELVRLTTGLPRPGVPPDAIHLEAVLNYRLRTVPRAFLLVFVFEDDARDSAEDTSQALMIPPGSGQVKLEIDHQPLAASRTITVLIGLFREDETMLTWVATTPIPLAGWPSRAAFERAMASRSTGNYAGAVDHLTAALQASPDSGSLYYWRAEMLMHLGRYDDAILDFTRALELMPGDRPSRVGRGIAWLWKGEWQAAVADLTLVLDDTAPRDVWAASAHRARGMAYSSLKEGARALADYQAYLELAPDAPDRAEVERWIAALK